MYNIFESARFATRQDAVVRLQEYLRAAVGRARNAGISVMATDFKRPLHRDYLNTPAARLHDAAIADIAQGRALTLTVRLGHSRDGAGHPMIAIDADTPDPGITERLWAALTRTAMFPALADSTRLFTAVGGKGFKVFARWDDEAAPPSRVGGTYKDSQGRRHEIEIKTTLAAFAGGYRPKAQDMNSPALARFDGSVYSVVPGTRALDAATAVGELPTLNSGIAHKIGGAFAALCVAANFTDDHGSHLQTAPLAAAVAAAVGAARALQVIDPANYGRNLADFSRLLYRVESWMMHWGVEDFCTGRAPRFYTDPAAEVNKVVAAKIAAYQNPSSDLARADLTKFARAAENALKAHSLVARAMCAAAGADLDLDKVHFLARERILRMMEENAPAAAMRAAYNEALREGAFMALL